MMDIGPQTSLHALLEAYPFLLDFLAGYHSKFSLLRNPVLRATMGRFATLEKVAGMGDIPLERLLEDVAARIAAETGVAPALALAPAPAADAGPAKIETLKGIIRKLHDGVGAEDARAEFTRLLGQVRPEEIAAMEQDLIREGMPVGEIHRLCDLHVNVFRDGLEAQADVDVSAPPGHPLHTCMAENRAIMQAADHWTELCRRAAAHASPDALRELRAALETLSQVETHYTRKENQLFPYLEKHGFTGPSQVMWALHDDVRRLLKTLRAAIASEDMPAIMRDGPEAARIIAEMIYKEEKILFPTAWRMLSDEEWCQIRAGDDEIGYALIPPPAPWSGNGGGAEAASAAAPDLIQLNTGALTLAQLDRMLTRMPVEFSFVDANDEVRYYSGHDERIFARSPAVIGRKVQNCHPPKSVHMVNAILDSFRDGTRDRAEFWLPFKDKFLFIEYYSVRDTDGRYLGALEVTQDISRFRTLAGEKRLLDSEPLDKDAAMPSQREISS